MKPSRIKEMLSELLHGKNSRRYVVTGALCVVAVVALGFFISLRGEGMMRRTQVLECPVEVHVHKKDCYGEDRELICGQADYVVHKHDDSCYDDNRLVCLIPEKKAHTHTSKCYDRELDCGQEEDLGHTHTQECYETDGGEPVLACGKDEHTHDDDECYTEKTTRERTCTQAEHTHDEGCYDEEGELACGKDEHTHDDDECYTEKTTRELSCTKKEHTHDGSCYEGGGESVLICAEEERPQGHVHVAGCYTVEEEPSCGELELHTHDESCYDGEPSEDGERVLICGKLELKEHQHGSGCFVIEESLAITLPTSDEDSNDMATVNSEGSASEDPDSEDPDAEDPDSEDPDAEEPDPEDPGAGEYIRPAGGQMILTNDDVLFTLSYFDEEQNDWVKLAPQTDLSPYLGRQFKVEVALKEGLRIDPEDLKNCGNLMTYAFPDYFDVNFTANGKIYEGGVEAAGLSCKNGKTAEMLFGADYLAKKIQNDASLSDLTFTVQGWFNWENIGGGSGSRDDLFDFPVSDLPDGPDFFAEHSNIDLEKTVSSKAVMVKNADGSADYYVEYTLKVTAGHFGAPGVKVEDVLFKSGTDTTPPWEMQSKWLYKNGGGLDAEEIYEKVSETGGGETAFLPRNNVYTDAGGSEHPWTSLEWDIGDMGPEEVRTLTYKVRLDPENMEKDLAGVTITNSAAAFAKTDTGEFVQKDTDTENKTLKETSIAQEKRVASVIKEEPDGSRVLTYLIRIANQNSEHLIDLYVKDSLKEWLGSSDGGNVTDADLLRYVTFEDIKIFKGNYASSYNNAAVMEKLEDYENHSDVELFEDERTKWISPASGDTLPGGENMEVLLKNLGNETVTLYYKVRVDGRAFNELDKKEFTIYNSMMWGIEPGERENFASTSTKVKEREWITKLQDGIVSRDGFVEIGPDDPVYASSGEPSAEHPSGFDIEKGYVKYKVTVDSGEVDISSWLMLDKLGGRHKANIRYVGYVEVTGYRKDENGQRIEPGRRVWLHVDDLKDRFSYTSAGLGFDAGYTDFELQYYVRTVDDEKLSQVSWENTFGLDGTGGDGGGRQLDSQVVRTTAKGGFAFTASKQGWYYDDSAKKDDEAWSDNGALYWVFEVQCEDALPSGTVLTDQIITSATWHYFHDDSVLGVYFVEKEVSFKDYENYSQFEAALRSGKFGEYRELERDEDYSVGYQGSKGSSTQPKLTITFKKAQSVASEKTGSDMRLYAVVMSDPSERPGVMPVTFRNELLSQLPNCNAETHNTATLHDSGKSGVEKSLINAYISGGAFKWVVNSTNVQCTKHWDASGNETNLAPGLFVTWAVKANVNGNLQGDFELVDTIPEGMEVVNVMVTGIQNYSAADSEIMPKPCDPISAADGWTKNMSKHYYGDQYHNYNDYDGWRDPWYYYTNGRQLMWGIRFPQSNKEGTLMKKDNAYAVSFMITCRVTDEDVLLGSGGEAVPFENNVTIYRNNGGQREDWGSSASSVELGSQEMLTKELIKGASEEGHYGTLQFMITVNERGWDLSPDDTITIVDSMSTYMKLDGEIAIYTKCAETKTGDTVVGRTFTQPLDKSQYQTSTENGGSEITITMPDQMKLYVVYDVKVGVPPDTTVSISNTVSYQGHQVSQGGGYGEEYFKYIVDGYVKSNDPTTDIEIRKRDKATMENLAGAKFTLEKVKEWDRENQDYISPTDSSGVQNGETGADGVARFADVRIFDIYCLRETQAPENYMLNSNPVYLLVTKVESAEGQGDGEQVPAQSVSDLVIRKAKALYPDVLVTGLGMGVPDFLITNTKNEITGMKKFLDEDGEPMAAVPEGRYTFGLYTADGEGEYQPVTRGSANYTASINVPEDKETGYTFKFENLDPGTYYVFELDKDGNRVGKNGKLEVDGIVFNVDYTYAGTNVGIELSSTESGTVMVTNSVTGAYKLPSAGGGGAALYTLSGLVILGAAALYVRKKRLEKQK